jgi:hypothetical protein
MAVVKTCDEILRLDGGVDAVLYVVFHFAVPFRLLSER